MRGEFGAMRGDFEGTRPSCAKASVVAVFRDGALWGRGERDDLAAVAQRVTAAVLSTEVLRISRVIFFLPCSAQSSSTKCPTSPSTPFTRQISAFGLIILLSISWAEFHRSSAPPSKTCVSTKAPHVPASHSDGIPIAMPQRGTRL